MKYLLLIFTICMAACQSASQSISPSSQLYSGRNQIKTFSDGVQTMKNHRVFYFQVDDDFFDLKQYVDLIGADEFESISVPHINVGSLGKEYRYIGVAYREFLTLGSNRENYFLTFLVKDINVPELNVLHDKNLNYAYHDDKNSIVVDQMASNIFLEFQTRSGKLDFVSPHPFSKKEGGNIIYSDTIILKSSSFNTSYHSGFTNWIARERTIFKFGVGAEFGLGGSGFHYYDYRNRAGGAESTISYEYSYRTGHFGLEPSVVYRGLYLASGFIYEIRQPRDGLYEVRRSDLHYYDNGVSKLFPKRRSIIYFGVGYEMHLADKINVTPFIKYGSMEFVGYAAEEFNHILPNGRSVMPGLKLDIALNRGQKFYLNLFANFDKYKRNDTVQFIDPTTGLPLTHFPSRHEHYQINIAFGYYVNVLSR